MFSSVLYLNDDWQGDDGGALVIYSANTDVDLAQSDKPLGYPYDHNNIEHLKADDEPAGDPVHTILPVGNRLVLFDSRLAHEVMLARRTRYSVTAWFRNDARLV